MARALLTLAALVLASILVTCISGCESPAPFVGGTAVPSPAGWLDYCQRHPLDHDCKKGL